MHHRAAAAGFEPKLGNHSFCVTGIALIYRTAARWNSLGVGSNIPP
jgi:hypothetical protein